MALIQQTVHHLIQFRDIYQKRLNTLAGAWVVARRGIGPHREPATSRRTHSLAVCYVSVARHVQSHLLQATSWQHVLFTQEDQ